MKNPVIYTTAESIREATCDQVDNGFEIKTPGGIIGKHNYHNWLYELQEREDNKSLRLKMHSDGKYLVIEYL